MVRLSSTLLAFAAIALLGCGSAFSTTLESDEVKTSHVAPQTLVQPIDPLSNADGNVKRFLRNVDARDESEEERVTSWKANIPGSAEWKAAAKANEENAAFKEHGWWFEELRVRNMDKSNVYAHFRNFRSEETAKKMELLYEKYKANPSAFHPIDK
ncbi:hypothetical protein PR003_g6025 [Phytophthora rubi]|uniref:RxLR effector protein n=1 Tax=Phytophthora rubi TaxID=129364 RepID=A0A6A3ND09_9STRA|nr:hypothetical protein PR002_g5801 [Phytophthora rubi]KAE9044146.1 hypothetical protein PR001_g5476 [Phytophthora rubi]KAE9349150.1 hypothetical protein PR003_g6025 [Phytophthora rubi]